MFNVFYNFNDISVHYGDLRIFYHGLGPKSLPCNRILRVVQIERICRSWNVIDKTRP